MALDTFTSVSNLVLLSCPTAGIHLARAWVSHTFRRIAERRRWSWLLKRGQFLVPALYSTGYATVTRSSATVTGNGTTWTSAMIGRQFRTTTSTPIYTITAVPSGTELTLDDEWGPSSATDSAYQIWQCYFEVPTDFHSFLTIWDPYFNWQLYRNYTQTELNMWDPRRSMTGQAYLVASFDYRVPTGETIGVPRYELWPHNQAEYCYPYLYETRATDLEDTGAVLPRYIRGDVLLQGALLEASRWPGPSLDKPNPYFNVQLASQHERKFEQMVAELEKQDDEVFEQNLSYMYPGRFPGFGDSAWMQRHAV